MKHVVFDIAARAIFTPTGGCIFTDDELHNCLGAKAAGMDAIHFTGPEAFAAGLTSRGLL